MPDVFISYSAKDEKLAQFVRSHLVAQQLDVFLASISLNTGEHWTPQIIESLRASEWVFLLASKNALASSNVQQEIGGAIFGKKKLVPIMWDVQPSDLPRWIGGFGRTGKSACTRYCKSCLQRKDHNFRANLYYSKTVRPPFIINRGTSRCKSSHGKRWKIILRIIKLCRNK